MQYHLEERLIERLGVHATLVHKSQSSVVGMILSSWLARHGRGRELFPPEEAIPEGLAELDLAG